MKNISELTDPEVLEQTLRAAKTEKEATLILLEYLCEVEKRRLHVARGYASLWEYVHKVLGYSEAQSYERIASMRLMRKIPEVRAELKSGDLNLSTASKLASHVRRENLQPAQTRALMAEISGKSAREVERVLAKHAKEPVFKFEKVRPLSQKTTRVTFDVGEEFIELLKRTKELQGNPALSLEETFALLMKDYVKRKEVRRSSSEMRAESAKVRGAPAENTIAPEIAAVSKNGIAPETAAASESAAASFESPAPPAEDSAALEALASQYGHYGGFAENPRSANASGVRRPFGGHSRPASRYIPAPIRHAIRIRSGDRCEYVDAETGRRCESRSSLEFDHRLPFAKGGKTELSNLRHYCRAHNSYAAIRAYGATKMGRYLKL